MPEEFWIETGHMLVAGAIVAPVALVLALLAWLAHRGKNLSLPPWRAWKAPWGCFEVFFVFVVIQMVIPTMVFIALNESGLFREQAIEPRSTTEARAAIVGAPFELGNEEAQAEYARIVHQLYAGVVALPLQLSLIVGWGRVLYPSWWRIERPAFSSQVLLAVAAWATLTPLVLMANGLITLIFHLLDWPTDTHQLARIAGRPALDAFLFLVQVCLAAPLIEEILFRGMILPWAAGGRKSVTMPDVPVAFRPAILLLLSLVVAFTSQRTGAMIFQAILAAGLGLVWKGLRRKRQTAGAIYSSAALFASMHSAVWPSPIPLFLLGLGLGVLAARTRSVIAPVLVHSLFNAVSAVFVLRGTS